jgi:hypothetical protein
MNAKRKALDSFDILLKCKSRSITLLVTMGHEACAKAVHVAAMFEMPTADFVVAFNVLHNWIEIPHQEFKRFEMDRKDWLERQAKYRGMNVAQYTKHLIETGLERDEQDSIFGRNGVALCHKSGIGSVRTHSPNPEENERKEKRPYAKL